MRRALVAVAFVAVVAATARAALQEAAPPEAAPQEPAHVEAPQDPAPQEPRAPDAAPDVAAGGQDESKSVDPKQARRDEQRRKKSEEKREERRRHAQLLALGCAVLSLSSLSLGVRLLRSRRPVVIPHLTIVPIVAAVVLFELNQWFGRMFRFDSLWVGGPLLLAIFWLALSKLREASRQFVVGGIGRDDAQELARAALLATRDPAAGEVEIVEDKETKALQLGKEGPALTVKENRAVGVVWFSLDEKAPAELRQLLWSAIVAGFDDGLIAVGVRQSLRYFLAAALLAGLCALFVPALFA